MGCLDLFSGAFAVSFREGSTVNLFVRLEGKKTHIPPLRQRPGRNALHLLFVIACRMMDFNKMGPYKVGPEPIVRNAVSYNTHMGVCKNRGYPEMDGENNGIHWNTLLKWMIWGYHYFWKHPYRWPENKWVNFTLLIGAP